MSAEKLKRPKKFRLLMNRRWATKASLTGLILVSVGLVLGEYAYKHFSSGEITFDEVGVGGLIGLVLVAVAWMIWRA